MRVEFGAVEQVDADTISISVSDLARLCGSTPIVCLPEIHGISGTGLAKLEKFNPAGSIKDRVAAYIISKLEREGRLIRGSVLVESSSGNLGIGLAMLGAERKLRVIIVVDPNTSKQNIAIMRAYGAEIVVETDRDEKGLFHRTKLERAMRIAAETGGYWVNQTANALNAEAHEATTGQEIVRQCGSCIDACLVATSSGGQIAGIAKALKASCPHIHVVAVDVVGSQIFSTRQKAYVTPGLGLSWFPVLINPSLVDAVCLVEDSTAFETARYLAANGLMVGPSSGAVAAATYCVRRNWPGARVLGVLPDGGERYLSTLFDDTWMEGQGFQCLPSSDHISEAISRLRLSEYHAN